MVPQISPLLSSFLAQATRRARFSACAALLAVAGSGCSALSDSISAIDTPAFRETVAEIVREEGPAAVSGPVMDFVEDEVQSATSTELAQMRADLEAFVTEVAGSVTVDPESGAIGWEAHWDKLLAGIATLGAGGLALWSRKLQRQAGNLEGAKVDLDKRVTMIEAQKTPPSSS